MLLEQQDAHLEALDTAVLRLGNMAGTINEELKIQNQMLSTLDSDIDASQTKMNVVTATLAKYLKTNDSCQIWTVLGLSLILIFLSTYLSYNCCHYFLIMVFE